MTLVLVVDDEEEIRALVRRSLTGDGFTFREAADGSAAIAAAEAERPDVVVLDWQMPGMSAPEVLSELKRRYPDVPVVLVTAALERRHGGLAGIYGADAFVPKPFSPAELERTVRSLLP